MFAATASWLTCEAACVRGGGLLGTSQSDEQPGLHVRSGVLRSAHTSMRARGQLPHLHAGGRVQGAVGSFGVQRGLLGRALSAPSLLPNTRSSAAMQRKASVNT